MVCVKAYKSLKNNLYIGLNLVLSIDVNRD